MLLNFVKFQVKQINFDGISKSSVVILEFRNLATHVRWDGRPCNSCVESFLENLPV